MPGKYTDQIFICNELLKRSNSVMENPSTNTERVQSKKSSKTFFNLYPLRAGLQFLVGSQNTVSS